MVGWSIDAGAEVRAGGWWFPECGWLRPAGLTWAALGGELVASAIEGEPLLVEGDLADAIDLARFLLQRAAPAILATRGEC